MSCLHVHMGAPCTPGAPWKPKESIGVISCHVGARNMQELHMLSTKESWKKSDGSVLCKCVKLLVKRVKQSPTQLLSCYNVVILRCRKGRIYVLWS